MNLIVAWLRLEAIRLSGKAFECGLRRFDSSHTYTQDKKNYFSILSSSLKVTIFQTIQLLLLFPPGTSSTKQTI